MAAYSGVALAVAATGWLPLVAIIALAIALVLLVESFGREVIWLMRRRRMVA